MYEDLVICQALFFFWFFYRQLNDFIAAGWHGKMNCTVWHYHGHIIRSYAVDVKTVIIVFIRKHRRRKL